MLPGLWLTANELHSLAAILHILNTMEADFLGEEIAVVQHHIEKLLRRKGIDSDAFYRSINYLSMNKCSLKGQHFSTITDALIHQKQVASRYTDYSGKITQRLISPQTLVYYRENWYIDAWCHKRHALRSFMLARINHSLLQKDATQLVADDDLADHYQSSYGIFAGKATETVELHFYASAAREAASIQWHPEQESQWSNDCYQLSFPYHDDRELIRDILKYGSNVTVNNPASLRKKIKQAAEMIAALYQ